MTDKPVTPATGPIPMQRSGPSWAEAFSVLKLPNYRRFVSSYAVLVTSLTMQRVMLAWSVLETSGDLTQVGFAIAMQYLPMMILGVTGGVVADRWAKRRTLLWCQVAFLVVALLTVVFATTESLSVPVIYAIGILIGIVQAFQMPTAQGIVGEIVKAQEIPPAVSFLSSAFQAGQVFGPAIGGILLAQLSPSAAWSINAFVICASLLMLLRVDPRALTTYHREPTSRVTASAGLRYIAGKPVLLVVLILIFVIAICVYATPVFLTAFAEQEFHIGAAGYGVLNSIMAAGALIGAFLSAKRPAPTLVMILWFTVALGISQVVMGIMFELIIFVLALFIRGATSLFTTTAANAFMQIRANPLIRGRVMSLYSMMMTGGMALGNLIVGALVAAYGVRPIILVTGVMPALLALLLWGILRYRTRK